MKNSDKRYHEEQIVRIVRECGVAEGTVYHWRSKYGGIETAALQCLWELEAENARLSASDNPARYSVGCAGQVLIEILA